MRSSRSAKVKSRTEVIKVGRSQPDEKTVNRAVRILKRGGLVAFPTDTVYGLAARFSDKEAVMRLSRVKNRPQKKPFTAHISDTRQAEMLFCEISGAAARLAERLWPGPLTMILPTQKGENVGLRMPDNHVALAVIAACGFPLAVPSANIHGRKPPKDAAAVLKGLDGKIDMLLDGGEADIGIASTVLDMTVFPCRILRGGAIGRAQISRAAGGLPICQGKRDVSPRCNNRRRKELRQSPAVIRL